MDDTVGRITFNPSRPPEEEQVRWDVVDLNISKECARRRRQMARRQDKYVGALARLSKSLNTMPPQPRGSIIGVSA